MKRISISLAVVLAVGGCAASTSPGASSAGSETRSYVSFGETAPGQQDAPVISAEQLLSNPSAYDGKYLRVTGTVAKVCAKKGCWLAMGNDPGLMVRFTCPISGRLIPVEAIGKEAVVEGTVKVVEESEAEARHLKEDAGAPAEEIAKIVGPQKRVTIAAPAAKVFGISAS